MTAPQRALPRSAAATVRRLAAAASWALAAAALSARAVTAQAAGCEEIYVSNEASGDLSVIDARSLEVTATLPLGKRPRGLKLAPDGRTLYVALSGSPIAGPGVDESKLPPADKSADGIGVVDLRVRRLVRVLRGVSDPEQLAVSADGATLFVASEDRGLAVVMDARSGTIRAQVPVGAEAEGVNLAPDGRTVYVTSEAEHRVTVLDAATGAVLARLGVGTRPRSTAFAPDGARAFVMNETDASITVVDARKYAVLGTFQLPERAWLPMSGAVSPDGRTLYVSTGRGRHVLALDAAAGTVRARVEAGARPWGLALSPDGARLYSANGPSDDVAVIDTRSARRIGTVSVGRRPWGVACMPEAAPAARR
jgi:YVTN family beta-propeller protein